MSIRSTELQVSRNDGEFRHWTTVDYGEAAPVFSVPPIGGKFRFRLRHWDFYGTPSDWRYSEYKELEAETPVLFGELAADVDCPDVDGVEGQAFIADDGRVFYHHDAFSVNVPSDTNAAGRFGILWRGTNVDFAYTAATKSFTLDIRERMPNDLAISPQIWLHRISYSKFQFHNNPINGQWTLDFTSTGTNDVRKDVSPIYEGLLFLGFIFSDDSRFFVKLDEDSSDPYQTIKQANFLEGLNATTTLKQVVLGRIDERCPNAPINPWVPVAKLITPGAITTFNTGTITGTPPRITRIPPRRITEEMALGGILQDEATGELWKRRKEYNATPTPEYVLMKIPEDVATSNAAEFVLFPRDADNNRISITGTSVFFDKITFNHTRNRFFVRISSSATSFARTTLPDDFANDLAIVMVNTVRNETVWFATDELDRDVSAVLQNWVIGQQINVYAFRRSEGVAGDPTLPLLGLGKVVDTTPVDVLPAPEELSFVNGDRSVELSWPDIDNAIDYDVYVRLFANSNNTRPTGTPTPTEQNKDVLVQNAVSPQLVTGLENGTRYVAVLRANNVRGKGEWSPDTSEMRPSWGQAPGDVSVEFIPESSVSASARISWVGVPGAQGYEIGWASLPSTGPGDAVQLATIKTTNEPFDLPASSSWRPGQAWLMRVRAYRLDTNGNEEPASWSAWVCLIVGTKSATIAPNAVTNLLTKTTLRNATIRWTLPTTGGIIEYVEYRYKTGSGAISGAWQRANNVLDNFGVSVPPTSVLLIGLTPNTTYSIEVRTTNTVGSSASASIGFTTEAYAEIEKRIYRGYDTHQAAPPTPASATGDLWDAIPADWSETRPVDNTKWIYGSLRRARRHPVWLTRFQNNAFASAASWSQSENTPTGSAQLHLRTGTTPLEVYILDQGGYQREISGTWSYGADAPTTQTTTWYLQTGTNIVWRRVVNVSILVGWVRHVDPVTVYPAREASRIILGETYVTSATLTNRDLTTAPWKDALWFHHWSADQTEGGIFYHRATTSSDWQRYYAVGTSGMSWPQIESGGVYSQSELDNVPVGELLLTGVSDRDVRPEYNSVSDSFSVEVLGGIAPYSYAWNYSAVNLGDATVQFGRANDSYIGFTSTYGVEGDNLSVTVTDSSPTPIVRTFDDF